MKRNWNAIHAITCGPVRTALACCSEERYLQRLQQAFPDCFEEGEETVIGVWSALLTKATEYYARSGYRDPYNKQRLHINWLMTDYPPCCLEFGINEEVRGNRDSYRDGPVPQEIRDQLQTIPNLDGPVILQYLGKEWVLGNIWVNEEADTLEHVHTGGDPALEGDFDLTIVPKECIVFDL
jgi:hypothetical protein